MQVLPIRLASLLAGFSLLPFAALSAADTVDRIPSIPLVFEENRGQFNVKSAAFLARFNDGIVMLHDDHIQVVRHGVSLDYRILGHGPDRPKLTGERQLIGRTSYLSGEDPRTWKSGIPNFRAVRYHAVYPGIDLLVYAKGDELEYDWEVGPGADPNRIRFSYPKAESVILPNGDLKISKSGVTIRHSAPRLYQPGTEPKRTITGEFIRRSSGAFGFRVGDYDKERLLVIDPYLIYGATFGGGSRSGFVSGTRGAGGCRATGIAVDKQGFAYVTGSITDPNGLPNSSPIQSKLGGAEDAFVVKLNKAGTDFEYAVFLGGPGFDEGRAIAVDAAGNAYVTGTTAGEFPVKGGLSNLRGGIFVAKINADGTELAYSFVFGGAYQFFPGDDGFLYTSAGNAIVVSTDGSAFVGGTTSGNPLPTTPNAFQRTPKAAACIAAIPACPDAFVGKIKPNGEAFDYLTYLSGSSAEFLRGIVIDELGQVTAAGSTLSSDYPVTPGALQGTRKSHPEENLPDRFLLAADGFLTRLSRDGASLIVSTYFGGASNDLLSGIARDRTGNLYIVGTGAAAADFPYPSGQTPPVVPPGTELIIFVVKISPSLSEVSYVFRSHVVRQTGSPFGIAVNSRGEALVGASAAQASYSRLQLQEREVQAPRSCYLNRLESCEVQYLFLLAADGKEMTFASEIGLMREGGRSRVAAVAFDEQDMAYVAGYGLMPNLLPSRLVNGTATASKIGFDADGPRFVGAAVVNAASFLPGIPSPGALVTIFGTGMTSTPGIESATGLPVSSELAGTSVIASGQYFPVLAVAGGSENQQVNAQIPWVSVTAAQAIGVLRDGKLGYSVHATSSPEAGKMGIFMLDPSQPAIVHGSDFSIVTPLAPTRSGETIVIFGTGLGRGLVLGQAPAIGSPAPFSPLLRYAFEPNVEFESLVVKAAFSGATPGFVGLDQINVVVPGGLPSGAIRVRIQGPPAFSSGTQQVRIHLQ
ncbi:MAG: SBBP repeat-containing protein [Acidobacteria bacterium]|nr:SBBP repeat-containing protein [Acidobacteriota bacterium]